MITRKDVGVELKNAEAIINDEGANVNAKFKAIHKLITVVIKIVLNNRSNTSLIMDTVGAKRIVSERSGAGSDVGSFAGSTTDTGQVEG